MRRTFRRAATAIAMAAILAGAFGCSGVKKGNRVSAGAPGSGATASPAVAATAGAGTPGQVTQAAFNEDADGARIVVTADVPLLYTAYEPRPRSEERRVGKGCRTRGERERNREARSGTS